MTDFNKFFAPSSIVFAGASSDPDKWGFRILANTVTGGFRGRMYPLNPKGGEILGLKVYTSMAEIPERPDLAVIVVPPLAIVETIRDCVAKGIIAGVVITAGFAEIGERGAALQAQMLEVARDGGMRLIGPNCFGIVSPPAKLYAQMPPFRPIEGSLAVVSQSGNVGATIARRTQTLDFGLSRLVSTGNEADLHAEDFVQYLGGDEKTKVILSYVEGFKDGRRFFEIAKQVTRSKPIVMIKAGETEAGASAARSHTASLSGADIVFDGISRQAGIVRVHNLAELMSVGFGFLCQPLPKGRRVGITTVGGGWGVLAADACAKRGLQVVRFSDALLSELDSFLPGWWSRNNPVDLVAGDADLQMRVIEILAASAETDAVIALGVPFPQFIRPTSTSEDERERQLDRMVVEHYIQVFQKITAISKEHSKPVIVAAEMFTPRQSAGLESEIRRALARNRAVWYSMPDEAAMVLHAMVEYSEYLDNAKE